MDYDYEEERVPSGFVTGIKFGFMTDEDAVKISAKEIEVPNDVTHPMLGIPSPLSSQCLTCGARDVKTCEGHFGVIKFCCTIINPYFISDIAKILNGICVGCKSERSRAKSTGLATAHKQRHRCKYCDGHSKDEYPRPQFKVSSKEIHGCTTIHVKINERILKEIESIASDYWGFIENDPQQQQDATRPHERILSHYQVYKLLENIDQKFLKELVGDKKNSLFINNFPVTPNSHRVNEFGQQMRFDERTRSYRKLVDFKSSSNELSARVVDCLKMSKLRSEKASAKVNAPKMFVPNEDAAKMSGLKFIRELIMGKRTDHAFRMVVIGDPSIKVGEIGVPCHIADAMLISEQLNERNWKNLGLEILTKGETYIRRGGRLVRVTMKNANLQLGDTIYRPLRDGDIVLTNRPPSIHPHSLIALFVKILPINSVLSLNPLICSPFRGDFDGDCYHGYIPQSIESRVELRELVALDKQLINTQSGQNLMALSHDSLTGAQLVVEDGVFLNRFQMQQLQMYCPQPRPLQLPAIIKASSRFNCLKATSSFTCLWTGKQLFGMLLPLDFDYDWASNSIDIVKGEVVSSQSASFWLRDTKGNLLCSLLSHRPRDFLEFLHAAQGLLCEWLSMRGLSVSLADIYLSPDCRSRKNMIDEVCCGLLEAEHISCMKLLIVDSNIDFLMENSEARETTRYSGVEQMFYDRQKSAALTQLSVSTFKHVFKDIQNLFYQYADDKNSFLAMLKAGSKKSNLTRAVQHGMCLGLQHSLVPLSFRIPHQLSCAAWNRKKALESLDLADDQPEFSNSYIPYAVVQNSFVSGLNPLECFVHSLTTRDSSFGGHADISGTLNRRIMFFMRDLCVQYDGTVRSAYGNHVIQFSYNGSPNPINSPDETLKYDACSMGGEPVGSLAACAISEAAYSALDQPISALEASPLLNLKEILECGGNKVNNAASLFLCKKLGRWTHGFEYAALEVKSHLERLLFLDIVSTVMIMYSREAGKQAHVSPWVCHFHLSKETVKRKQVKVQSIIDALYLKCNSTRLKSKANLPDLHITTKECSEKNIATICIAIRIIGSSKNSSTQLDILEDTVIPFLLKTVIKGSSNVKKVDVLWKDPLNVSTSRMGSSGELFLRVFMSETCDRSRFWAVLMDDCLKVMDIIDWERSYPEDIQAAASALGIDIAKTQFISKLASAISDTGKAVLPKHISLVADCLSSTGEFVAMSANGLARQRKQTSISSPLTQACFSSPADCFVNAAKIGSVDNLQGSIDALAWGNSPSLGTGAQFDIEYSGKGREVEKHEYVYNLLGSLVNADEQKVKTARDMSVNSLAKKSEFLRKNLKATHFLWMSENLRNILHRYGVNEKLIEFDEEIAIFALKFHPRYFEKIGCGLQEIKIVKSSKYSSSCCFQLVRTDGTEEEFSYHKCIHHALKSIDPISAHIYESKWLHGRN